MGRREIVPALPYRPPRRSLFNNCFATRLDSYITNTYGRSTILIARQGVSLATSVYRFLLQAGVASDFATPTEPALTVDLLLNDPGVVSPAATEQLTAIDTLAGGVAPSPLGAQRARFPVRFAEVRRVLAVDQIEPVGWFDGRPLGDEAVPVVARDHLRRAIKRLLQSIAHVAERRHFPPTGADRARSGQTVALALCPHEVPHCLWHQRAHSRHRTRIAIFCRVKKSRRKRSGCR